jgi:hypothetical protein
MDTDSVIFASTPLDKYDIHVCSTFVWVSTKRLIYKYWVSAGNNKYSWMTFFYKQKQIIERKEVSFFFKDKILIHNIHTFFFLNATGNFY